MGKLSLPEDCRLENYGGDLVMVGVNLNAGKFEAIKGTLPVDIQSALIGWKRIGR